MPELVLDKVHSHDISASTVFATGQYSAAMAFSPALLALFHGSCVSLRVCTVSCSLLLYPQGMLMLFDLSESTAAAERPVSQCISRSAVRTCLVSPNLRVTTVAGRALRFPCFPCKSISLAALQRSDGLSSWQALALTLRES
jgi:hypothetical protein